MADRKQAKNTGAENLREAQKSGKEKGQVKFPKLPQKLTQAKLTNDKLMSGEFPAKSLNWVAVSVSPMAYRKNSRVPTPWKAAFSWPKMVKRCRKNIKIKLTQLLIEF